MHLRRFLYVFTFVLFFGAIYSFGSFQGNLFIDANQGSLTEACAERSGVCVGGYDRTGVACILPGGGKGINLPNLCDSNPTDYPYYTCCVPVENINEGDGNTDKACLQAGGVCMSVYSDVGMSCPLPGGNSGTIKGGLCYSKPHDLSYRCCVPEPEMPVCGSNARYYPDLVSEYPSDDFCVVGVPQPSRPPFPIKEGGSETWTCSNDGKSVTCYASRGEDRVRSNAGCVEVLKGECQETGGSAIGSGALGECQVNGEPGCYVFGTCREKPQEIREDNLYLCCTTDEEYCKGGVEYEKWDDVYLNGDCPFSKPSADDDKLWCSQGVETDPSHVGDQKPSVDIRYNKVEGGEGDLRPGTEYFIAPEDGVITKARAFYRNYRYGEPVFVKSTGQVQKCGCHLEFVTDDGVTYDIRHCFLFAGIGRNYDSNTGNLLPGKQPLTVKKGEVLAKVAINSDSQVIDNLKNAEVEGGETCSSGAHFHVKVEGGDVDRCVDCYFVDKYGCNLYNDGSISHKGECGRCWREEGGGIPECFDPSWGGLLCDDDCASCKIDPDQYCCESDRVWCCVGPPTAQICAWVCDCPHTSP